MLSYAHCIREDPVRRGLLYLGTENAIYVSFDDGEHWQPLQNNMPHAPVYWITVQEHFNDLVIATYGRGFWIMDDITPLQQLTRRRGSAPTRISSRRAPRIASATITQDASAPTIRPRAQNPHYGASINYFLKAPPAGDVDAVDCEAARIRSFGRSPRRAAGSEPRVLGSARRALDAHQAAHLTPPCVVVQVE